MTVRVTFYSYFKEIAGCTGMTQELSTDSTLGDLLDVIYKRFPTLAAMRKSTLVAVGVEYQNSGYRLQEGDEISLFPPVQGG